MLTFTMTHSHPTLGRLKIGFIVNERGAFMLDTIDIRWRWQPYAYPHFWTVYFWRNEDHWAMNYWSSRWANGLPDDTAAHAEEHMTFLPTMLDFANSADFAALVGRKLKRSIRLMNAATQDAAGKAQHETPTQAGERIAREQANGELS